jgi:hypothetical protein
MRTHLRVAAAALVVLGVATGCERTTPGTVAMTTQPGPQTTTRTTMPRPPTTDTPVPEVPAPPNALTMTCREFNELDEPTRLAVIRAILADQNSVLGQNIEIARALAESVCQFLPDSTVNEILLGGSPP